MRSLRLLLRVLMVSQMVQGFSRRCREAATKLGQNFTRFEKLSKDHFRMKRHGGHQEQADVLELSELAAKAFHRREELRQRCPPALMVAAAINILVEMNVADRVVTNFQHEQHFKRLSTYEKAVLECANVCQLDEAHWPLEDALEVVSELFTFLKSRVDAMDTLMAGAGIGLHPDITNEDHWETLANVSEVMESEGLEWWPCRGTLIALLRHGARSGSLADDQLDVVDHDVDIMIGVPSEEVWLQKRWTINEKLMERGWQTCFGRSSVDEVQGSIQHQMAREDLLLCVRENPHMVLDMSSYIVDPKMSIVYAQRYCIPQINSCYIPEEGFFRAGRGRLRKSAIYPMGRCKAGAISVPCPHRPLETLKACMHVNFTNDCVALPDIEKRKQRDFYASDTGLQELRAKDMEVLKARSAEMDAAGYMSMTPYFADCT